MSTTINPLCRGSPIVLLNLSDVSSPGFQFFTDDGHDALGAALERALGEVEGKLCDHLVHRRTRGCRNAIPESLPEILFNHDLALTEPPSELEPISRHDTGTPNPKVTSMRTHGTHGTENEGKQVKKPAMSVAGACFRFVGGGFGDSRARKSGSRLGLSVDDMKGERHCRQPFGAFEHQDHNGPTAAKNKHINTVSTSDGSGDSSEYFNDYDFAAAGVPLGAASIAAALEEIDSGHDWSDLSLDAVEDLKTSELLCGEQQRSGDAVDDCKADGETGDDVRAPGDDARFVSPPRRPSLRRAAVKRSPVHTAGTKNAPDAFSPSPSPARPEKRKDGSDAPRRLTSGSPVKRHKMECQLSNGSGCSIISHSHSSSDFAQQVHHPLGDFAHDAAQRMRVGSGADHALECQEKPDFVFDAPQREERQTNARPVVHDCVIRARRGRPTASQVLAALQHSEMEMCDFYNSDDSAPDACLAQKETKTADAVDWGVGISMVAFDFGKARVGDFFRLNETPDPAIDVFEVDLACTLENELAC